MDYVLKTFVPGRISWICTQQDKQTQAGLRRWLIMWTMQVENPDVMNATSPYDETGASPLAGQDRWWHSCVLTGALLPGQWREEIPSWIPVCGIRGPQTEEGAAGPKCNLESFQPSSPTPWFSPNSHLQWQGRNGTLKTSKNSINTCKCW